MKPSVNCRAFWTSHAPFGYGAMPAISTRRVDNSITKKTACLSRPKGVQTSTVKKSQAASESQCWRMNSFQVVFLDRSGAGSMPWFLRMRLIVVSQTVCPTLARAPWILQSLWGHNAATGSQQLPAQRPAFDGQASPLVVVQPGPFAAEQFPKHTILLIEIIDDVALFAVHPSRDGDQEELPWIQTHG